MEWARFRLLRVLLITWIGYAAYSMGRRPFSVARAIIMKDTGISVADSGWVDTSFLIMYTVAQMYYSRIQTATNMSSRALLVCGLLGSAATQVLTAMSTTMLSFALAAALNGTMQAVGWSSCMVVVTPWIAPSERGSVMGLWGTTVAIGGVLGNTVTPTLIDMLLGWRPGVLAVGALMAGAAALMFFLLAQHPNAHGFLSPTQEAKGHTLESLRKVSHTRSNDGELLVPDASDSKGGGSSRTAAIGPRQLLAIPGVAAICASFFFAKLVRYVLMFWLPYFFTDALHHSASSAGLISSALDIGGVIGTIGCGYFCDRFGGGKRRTLATIIISIALAVVLSGFSVGLSLADNLGYAAAVCFGCGFATYGLDMIMTGSLLQDVADRQGVSEHVGGISGMVGGIGTLGAVVQGPFTVSMAALSWSGVFGVLQGLTVVSAACLVPALRTEARAQTSGEWREEADRP